MKILRLFFCISFFWLCVSTVSADTVYYDEAGNKITQDEYKRIVADRKKGCRNAPKFKPTPMQANTDTDVPVDRFGRPLKDAQGRWITYPGNENPGSFVVKRRNTDKSESGDMSAARKADRYKEQYLKSGNTSDLLKYQREHKKAMGYSTDESGDMSAARKADRYKKQYLKSGKTSDLLKYQREHKKAMGY